MCVARPGGTHSGPPQSIVRRLMQWIGFTALLSAMFAVGPAKWLRHRLSATGSA